MITAHPAVDDCAVVGVPDPVRSGKVIALVVPVAGTSITPDEVQAHCRERLATFKLPSVVELRAELPKTSIGRSARACPREELRR